MRIVKNYVIRYVFMPFKEFLKFILKYLYRLELHLKMPEYTIFIMLHSTSNVYIVSTHASSFIKRRSLYSIQREFMKRNFAITW